MWLFTVDGFYSAVKDAYCQEGEIVVRSRQREDLQRFLKRVGLKGKILEFPEADYLYRVTVPHTAWTDYVTRMATELNYPNFKRTIANTGDHERHHTYGECWFALRTWQVAHAKHRDLYW